MNVIINRHGVLLIGGLLVVLGLFWMGCEPQPEADPEIGAPEAAEEPQDTLEGEAVVDEPVMPVESDLINYGDPYDREYFGLFAQPEDLHGATEVLGLDPEQPLPGLLLVHHGYGLDDTMLAEARRYAGEGFQVLAVDLFDTQTATTEDEAAGLVSQAQLHEGPLVLNLEAGQDFLAETRQAPRLGIVGWSFGGTTSFQALGNWPERFDAAVLFYSEVGGISPADIDGFDGHMLLIVGEEDEMVDRRAIEEFEGDFIDAGYDVEVMRFEGVGHDFANPLSQNYDQNTARMAYEEAVYFLQRHLHQGEPEETLSE